MSRLIHYLAADFQKTKRLPIRKAHIFIPMGIAGIFLVYYTYSPWDAVSKVGAYFQILGMGFPFLTGLFGALISEQEQEAGAFREILGAPQKTNAFFSKLLLLALMGFFSVFLASLLFGAGYIGLLHQHCVDFSFYVKSALLLWGCSLPLYLWHLLLAFCCNRGISIGVGIMESLLAALMITGMGDGIWLYFPAAWAPRMITALLTAQTMRIPLDGGFYAAVTLCFLMTAALLAAFGVWAHFWEGTNGGD